MLVIIDTTHKELFSYYSLVTALLYKPRKRKALYFSKKFTRKKRNQTLSPMLNRKSRRFIHTIHQGIDHQF